MLDLSIAFIDEKNRTGARSRAVHESMMLVDRENWLLYSWAAIQQMQREEKGPALEKFLEEWVRADSSMKVQGRDVRGGTDELDLVLELKKNSPLSDLLNQSQFALIECKNTTQPTGARDIRRARKE
jgi:hypothetical protein